MADDGHVVELEKQFRQLRGRLDAVQLKTENADVANANNGNPNANNVDPQNRDRIESIKVPIICPFFLDDSST